MARSGRVVSSGVVGIVLAAGRSSRMGRSKALLPLGTAKQSFTAHIVETLRAGGVTDVVVVGRSDDDPLRAEVAALPPTVFVDNPRPERGQLSSLVVGIEYAQRRGASGALVLPVDIPLVMPRSVAAALDAFVASTAPIVRVTHSGEHGHPVIFRRTLFDELRGADPARGAKAVVHAHAADVLDVAVDDPGVLRDVDLPEDYRSLFGTLPG